MICQQCEQINNYLPKLKAEANNDIDLRDHCSFDQLKMSNHSLKGRGSDLPFSHKSVVSIAHEPNIICSKTLICRQLFAGHVVGFWPMKTKEKIYRMIIIIIVITK